MTESHRKIIDGPLSVELTTYGEETAVVSFAGELDHSTVATAAAAVREALGGDRTWVVIDLEELEFLDVAGLALLSGLSREICSAESLRIVPSRSLGVTRILTATGMTEVLRVVHDGITVDEPSVSSPIKTAS